MSTLHKVIFFLLDLLFLNLSIYFSLSLVSDQANLITNEGIYLLVFSNLAWLFLTLVSNPYDMNKGWSLSKIMKAQAAFICIHLLVVASLIFSFKKSYSPVSIGMIYIVFIVLSFAAKISIYYVRKMLIPRMETINYLLIGDQAVAREIRNYYLLNPQLGYRFKGHFDFDNSNESFEKIRTFSAIHEIHEIFCCAASMSNESLKSLVDFGLNTLVKVKLVMDASTTGSSSVQFEKYEKEPGISVAAISLDESTNQWIKRLFDLIFSFLFFILVLSWLLPIVALLIKLDSKGPVFFVQERNGEGNKPFGCIKFRTMVVNKEADSKQAVKDDPRITPIGSFLRKSSIDELPQFLNVLKGDMSLIGPRPHPIQLNEKFSSLISTLMSRHYVKPGITGLAQCMGYRGETQTLADMENRVRLDRYYIENWSFWLDIKIIFLTVVSLIRGSDKAY
jgi:putative colanic acid biosysnthesis UDP-glucose lipid carrier transferase